MRKNFYVKHHKAVRNVTCALLVGVFVAGIVANAHSDIRPGGLDDSVEWLKEQGLYEDAVANGYVSPEVAAQEAALEGESTPQAPSTPTETPSGSDSSSGESTTPASTSSEDTSNNTSGTTEAKKSTTPKKVEVVITESEVSGTFVMTTATGLYDTNKKSNKVSSLDAGTAVNVTAETSNGLFKTEDNYYFDKTKCVTADTWESGWQETDRVDATCTEAGSVTYNNSNNTEITKTEEIAALGHAYEVTDTKEPTCTEKGSTTYTCSRCGDTYTEEAEALGHQKGEWEVTKEPGLFSEGKKVIKCTVCGEVLETEVIKGTIPEFFAKIFE